jgi:hypothetical protein
MNTKKYVIHHTMGYCGYAGKEETWQEQEEKAIQLGATPATANWTERSKIFVLGHGAILTAERGMEFKIDKVKHMEEMIEKAHAKSEEGTFLPSRDMMSYGILDLRASWTHTWLWKQTLEACIEVNR